jgi:hypothetical protein
MSSSAAIRQFTLRLPEPVLVAAKRLAERRKLSVNAFIRSLLEGAAESDRLEALRDAYDQLGQDRTDTDVAPFRAAQLEVLRRG